MAHALPGKSSTRPEHPVIEYPIIFWMAVATAYPLALLIAKGLLHLGFPTPSETARFVSIDGLRGILALCVVLHHFSIWYATSHGIAWGIPENRFLAQLGTGAVGLFFMITGLVFYPRVRDGIEGTDWPALLVTRIMRILPLVAVSVAVIGVIALTLGHGVDVKTDALGVLQWLSTWREPDLFGYADTGRINAYVLWSLWWEWVFYLAVLPILSAMRSLSRNRLPSWTIPLALLVLGGLGRLLWWKTIFLSLFACGMLAAEIRDRPALRAWFQGRLATALSLAVLLPALIFTPNPYGPALLAFGLFFTCVACGNSFASMLDRPAARVLGECSFGIYLLHGIVLYTAFALTERGYYPVHAPVAALLIGVVPIVVGVAAIGYLVIERPAYTTGKAFAKRMVARPPKRRADPMELEVAP